MLIVFFTILLYFSLASLLLLFLIKYFELKTGKSIIPDYFIVKIESAALRFFLKVARLRAHITRENVTHVIAPARQKLAVVLLALQRRFNLYFSKMVDMVQGKGTLIKRGKSSNFLSNIGEYKNIDNSERNHKFL